MYKQTCTYNMYIYLSWLIDFELTPTFMISADFSLISEILNIFSRSLMIHRSSYSFLTGERGAGERGAGGVAAFLHNIRSGLKSGKYAITLRLSTQFTVTFQPYSGIFPPYITWASRPLFAHFRCFCCSVEFAPLDWTFVFDLPNISEKVSKHLS